MWRGLWQADAYMQRSCSEVLIRQLHTWTCLAAVGALTHMCTCIGLHGIGRFHAGAVQPRDQQPHFLQRRLAVHPGGTELCARMLGGLSGCTCAACVRFNLSEGVSLIRVVGDEDSVACDASGDADHWPAAVAACACRTQGLMAPPPGCSATWYTSRSGEGKEGCVRGRWMLPEGWPGSVLPASASRPGLGCFYSRDRCSRGMGDALVLCSRLPHCAA